MDVVGIGIFFGASLIAGIAQDGYFDWLLPLREQPPVDPPVVTVVHHTVTVTRRIIRTTPSFVTVFESVPTYITLAAEPYHKIWSLSWTDLLQCTGPFLILLLFILLMLWWLGHDDTADTAPVDGAESPSPPSSPQPSGAKPSEDTKHEIPDSPGHTAHGESSSEDSSSTGSTRAGSGFFRRRDSDQVPPGPVTRFGRRPVLQPARISRGIDAEGQEPSAGPAAGRSLSGSGTGNALRNAITFGRASSLTSGTSDRAQDSRIESNNGRASRSGDSEVPGLSRGTALASPDSLPPYVPTRQQDPGASNRPSTVSTRPSRILVNRDGAQAGNLSDRSSSSSPPSSRPSPSSRHPAQQHARGTLNLAGSTTPLVDAVRPRPEVPFRGVVTPLANIPPQVLPHSGVVDSALGPITEETSAQDGHRQTPNSPPGAVPDDDTDLIEFSGLEPEQEDDLPDHPITGPNVIQQRDGEAGRSGGTFIPADQVPDLDEGASDGTLEPSNRLGNGSAPRGGTRSESSESSEANSSDEEDDEDLEFEDVQWSRPSRQLPLYRGWRYHPARRASDQIENLLITVPDEQQNVDNEDTGETVDSAHEEAPDREDETTSEKKPENAPQGDRLPPSRSPGQTIGPGLATSVTSPTQTTSAGAPSSQPTASPVTPQRSVASDEHDELYNATPEAEQRRRARELASSRFLAAALPDFAGPAASSDPDARQSEETNGQEQEADTASLPPNRSEAAVTEPLVNEQGAPTETGSRPLYADFMGQTGALRTSATSSEPTPSSLPADVWSSQPFPAPDPVSSTTNGADRAEETCPLARRRIAQSHISMQGHTPQRAEGLDTHPHQENRPLLALPHPAREEAFESEMPSARDVDNIPHFWAPGERSQVRRLREPPSRDSRRVPMDESALDRATPLRSETTATQDFGNPSSPEDGLVQPSSIALADPFTEADSQPNAPREARGSIVFSVPPLTDRARNDGTDAENGENETEAQEDSSHQQGPGPSRQTAADPTTPAERTRADNPVTPNTASSTATQVIISPHSGTVARDCPHWTSGNFCPRQHAMTNPCPLVHEDAKLKRDRNGKVLCSFFLAGRCNRGKSCGNSHDMGDQNGSTAQQPASTAPVVPTQASQGLQAPRVVAGPSRLAPQPVPTVPVGPAQTAQEPQVPQAAAASRDSTQQPSSSVQVVPAQAAQQTGASQPAGGPSRSVPRNEDEQVDDMMATISTGVSTSMWANNNQHGRRRSRPANPASNLQTQPRPVDVQAQSAFENPQPQDTATGSATTANEQGDHNSVPQNAASNPQLNVTTTQLHAASNRNSDELVVIADAASNTQPEGVRAEPATAVNDDENPIAAPQNAEPSAQPESASPEPTASIDDSGQSAGPQNAAPDTRPDIAPLEPATTSQNQRDRIATPQSAAPNPQSDSPSSKPATPANNNGDQSATSQNEAQSTQSDGVAPQPATTSNNNTNETAVPRDPDNAASRVQQDPEERAVNALMANMTSGASKSMWADDETEEPTDAAPVVDQQTQVSSKAQGQQPADANQNETGPSEIEQEPAPPVVDDFHRATLPEDHPRTRDERRLLNAIADLEEFIAADEDFIARYAKSRDKATQVKVSTKQSGLGQRREFLERNRNLLLELRQRPLEGPSKQSKQPQPSAGPNGAADDQSTVRPQASANTEQDATKSKGKEKQMDPSQEDDSAKSAAIPMPGQESLWSDTNYVAPAKQKGKGKQKQQQQQKKNTASQASTTASAAASSALPHGNNPPPAQPQSGANNQASASTQPPTAAQTSANTPASEQVQVPETSQSSNNAGAATNPQPSSDNTAALTPHVNGNGPPGTGSSETPNASGIPDGSSQPQSPDTNHRSVNTALVPDYTQSKKAQDAVQSLGQKSQVSKIQEVVKEDAKTFSWADEFDDTETFTPQPEIKQVEQAPQYQAPMSAQDTSGNPQRQPAPSKPEDKPQAISSVQPPSKAEQKLMNQIQRLEKKHSNDLAIMNQCMSSGNVSQAKQLKEQDIPYNKAGLLQLRANLEKINPQNPLLRPEHIESVSNAQPANATAQSAKDNLNQQSDNVAVQPPGAQDDKPTSALSKSIWSTDAPDDDALKSAPPQPVAANATAEQQSENAVAQAANVEDELPTQGISDSRWANLPDVDLSARAPRKKAASTNNAGPSNKNSKGNGNNDSKANGNNSTGNESGSSKGNGSNSNATGGGSSKGNSNNPNGNGGGSSKGNSNNPNGNGSDSSKGNGNNSKSNGKNNKKKGNGKKK